MTQVIRKGSRRDKFVLILLGLITLTAFVLRFWKLDAVPPGWRDDELINSLVISQKVIDGDLALYYADASGHEALYHALNGVMLALFGPGVAGIRWLSALLGTLTISLTFLVGRKLFGSMTGLFAAAVLSVGFWSLMYSRIGIRHVLTPVLALAAFYFFLRGLGWASSGALELQPVMKAKAARPTYWLDFFLAALFMGLGFYTYFAGRGVPLILLAFCIYAFLFARDLLKGRWPGLLLMFGLAALMAIPLLVTLGQQPESEARVAELAVPLIEARAGNFDPLQRHLAITFNMFHTDGDDEWLYNIPHRPIFGPVSALFFWTGVVIALLYALSPIASFVVRRLRKEDGAFRNQQAQSVAPAAAFLLLWWLAGISPAFISVPPASLGHTILAQSAVAIIAVLPVWWLSKHWFETRKIIPVGLGVLLVALIAVRDLPDYFQEWPQRGMTRFLYRAEIHEVAQFLNQNPGVNDFGMTGLLAGPWDKLALATDLSAARSAEVSARWYNPQRALLLNPPLSFSGYPEMETPYADFLQLVPDVSGIGAYRLYEIDPEAQPPDVGENEPICFENGLCLISAAYNSETARLELEWLVQEGLKLPPLPLISNPPPPGVYAGPRLHVFAQLQDQQGNFLVGDDGLWVDPATLQAGDRFVQQHWLRAPEGQNAPVVVFGLYDPKTGERVLTSDGQDSLYLAIEE